MKQLWQRPDCRIIDRAIKGSRHIGRSSGVPAIAGPIPGTPLNCATPQEFCSWLPCSFQNLKLLPGEFLGCPFSAHRRGQDHKASTRKIRRRFNRLCANIGNLTGIFQHQYLVYTYPIHIDHFKAEKGRFHDIPFLGHGLETIYHKT